MKRLLIVTILGSVLSACGADSLDGVWEGELDCGPGTVDIDMELSLFADGDNNYSGEGSTSWTSDAYWQVDFDVRVAHDDIGLRDDTIPLQLDFDNCDEIDLGEVPCADVTADWLRDVEEVSGTVEELGGGEDDCDLLLYR